MFKVELYGRVRRAVLVEGRSQRAVAREFGIARKTIQKMLRYSVPPGYQRQQAVKRPKLGPWLGVIDAILEEDKARPAKQRHTATRIFERLKAEHGFSGCYTIVKDYVHAIVALKLALPIVHHFTLAHDAVMHDRTILLLPEIALKLIRVEFKVLLESV